MPAATNWRLISLVSVVQVMSESVFFAQGIMGNNDETIGAKLSEQNEFDWMRICVPLFYAATRQISEPCWRWILGGYGDRMTTTLGIATITVSIVAASCQEILAGNAAYIILGGVGMGLVRLQLKYVKSRSGNADWPLLGAGITGIGLSLWPLLACLCVRRLGSKYAMLIFAAITLHAIPFAMFVSEPTEEEEEGDRQEDPEDNRIVRSTILSHDIPFTYQEEDRLNYQSMDYNSYRIIRPSYYVEVLPGIPEEVEHESDHDLQRDHETLQCEIVPEVEETERIYTEEISEVKSSLERDKRRRKSNRIKIKLPTAKSLSFKKNGIEPKPFDYTIFVSTILLRLGDQLVVTIIISFLPIFAGYLMPNLRLQEKAFLTSLCGFSKILAEFPLLALYTRSRKTKIVFICGPIFAAVGLCLTWNSATLDAMTLASFGLGIGSGAASAALQGLTPRESPGICDIADFVIGFSLLAIIPLARIFILGNVIQGCLLLAAGIYAAAAITSVFNFRKTV